MQHTSAHLSASQTVARHHEGALPSDLKIMLWAALLAKGHIFLRRDDQTMHPQEHALLTIHGPPGPSVQ